MTIDIWTENLISISAAAKLPVFHRNGRCIHVATLSRYAYRGVRSRSGERVKLETIKIPGGVRTSREAVERFIERLNATNPDAPTPSQVYSDHAIAAAQLQAAGM